MTTSGPHIKPVVRSQAGTVISISLSKKNLMYIRHKNINVTSVDCGAREYSFSFYPSIFLKFPKMWAHKDCRVLFCFHFNFIF